MPLSAQWEGRADITRAVFEGRDRTLSAGLYEVIATDWRLEPEVEGTGRIGNIPEYYRQDFDAGPHCRDRRAFEWHLDDATHII